MVLDEGYPINLDVVDLGSKLHASDDRTDVGAVNADNAVLHFLFFHQFLLLTPHLVYSSYTLTLLCIQTYRGSVQAAQIVPLAVEFA